jgi:hypothetical protein
MKKEKTLVILYSETREHQHTFDNFKRYVLNELNADLALCVAINDRENQNNPFYNAAKYIWQYQEPEDWGDAFDYASEYEQVANNWRILKQVKDQWLGGIKGEQAQKGSAGILLFFRWLTKNKLLENKLLNEYDRFIYTRSDYLYETPHIPLELLSKDKIWIPDGEDYGGVTDRHMVCSALNIISALSIADPMIKAPQDLVDTMSYFQEWNLEQFIKLSFQKTGIWDQVQRFPFTMYSLRSEGGHTSWREGKFNKNLGYYVKYPHDYYSAMIAKNIFKKRGGWTAKSMQEAHGKIIKRDFIWGKLKRRFKYYLSLCGITIDVY